MEGKDNLATVGQNLIQIIMLHKILMKDRDNLPVEQTHIQDMVLHRTPTVLRTLTAHHLRKTPMVLLLHNTVSHLISRVATDMDMHPHSKRLDQLDKLFRNCQINILEYSRNPQRRHLQQRWVKKTGAWCGAN